MRRRTKVWHKATSLARGPKRPISEEPYRQRGGRQPIRETRCGVSAAIRLPPLWRARRAEAEHELAQILRRCRITEPLECGSYCSSGSARWSPALSISAPILLETLGACPLVCDPRGTPATSVAASGTVATAGLFSGVPCNSVGASGGIWGRLILRGCSAARES